MVFIMTEDLLKRRKELLAKLAGKNNETKRPEEKPIKKEKETEEDS